MKQIIFILIVILSFIFIVSAQTNENNCQKIIIKAPDYVYTETTFQVFATFETDTDSNSTEFDWTIVNEDEVTKIKQKKFVEITSKDIEYGETGNIIVLVEISNKNCNDVAIAKIPFFQPVGSPHIIDIYGELKWNDEKIRLDNAVIETDRHKDAELLIFIGYDDKLEKNGVKNYLSKILEHLTSRGLRKNQVSFLTEYSKNKQTKLQLLPKELDAADFYKEYLIIKGEDLEKLAKMFK